MSKCIYHEICGLNADADPAAGLCILHARNPEKDKDVFGTALEAHWERHGSDFRKMFFASVQFFSFKTFPGEVDFSEAVFATEIDFIKSTFTKEADFGAATFHEGVNFYGATFNDRANFYNATFNKEASFNTAAYHEEAYFAHATFLDEVHFNETSFAKEVVFAGARFGMAADFLHAVFLEDADFTGADFSDEAWFEGLTFDGEAHFGGAVFTKPASFGGATFTKVAEFDRAKFLDEAVFSNVRFIGDADFAGVTFAHGVRFGGALLTGVNSFRETSFVEQADFAFTIFKDLSDFTEATFMKGANFSHCRFFDRCSFQKAIFANGADFQETFFKGESVDFSYSTFRGRTIFSAQVEDRATIPIFSWFVMDFREPGLEPWRRKFLDEAFDSTGGLIANVYVDFREVVIDPPDSVCFREANLRMCLLQGTDLRKVEFTGVFWPKFGNRVGVFDERAPLEGGILRSWSRLHRLYGDIKQSYESRQDYILAGDFHYGEMDMRLRNPTTNFGVRMLLRFYRLFSGYGERYMRPVMWLAILIVVSTFAYLWLGIEPKAGATKLALTDLGDWFRASYFSFRVMTVQKPEDYVPAGDAKNFHVVLSILGPVFLSSLSGLFVLAIKQRLKR